MKKIIILIVISFAGFSGSEAQNLNQYALNSRVNGRSNPSGSVRNVVMDVGDSGSVKNISSNIR